MPVLIGAIAKNIEKSMLPLLSFLIALQTDLPDAHVFLYEDGSTDLTRSYFPLLESVIKNIHIQSEDISQRKQSREQSRKQSHLRVRWDNKPCRMELIANARNKLLEMIEAHGYADDDLIIMFDSDIREAMPTEPLLRLIRDFPSDADGIFANGLSARNDRYYDMYALRFLHGPQGPKGLEGPELRGDEFWNTLPQIKITQRTPVVSAFGGLAIYRGYCLKHNSYSAIPTKDLDRLYKSILPRTELDVPIAVEAQYKGAILGAYLFGEGPYDESHSLNPSDIFYRNNSGYNFPVVCEHSIFHATMTMRGQGRFFIDPDLLYYSDH